MRFAYIEKPLAFFLGVCAFAWAIGFARYFDHWVYFSAFPNILDSLGMSLVGVYLLSEALSKKRGPKETTLGTGGGMSSVFSHIDSIEES